MTSQLPKIELPLDVPLPQEWGPVVEQLYERAVLVEEWANICRNHVTVAITANENVMLLIAKYLEQDRIEEAKRAAKEASDAIKARRAGHH